MSLAVPHPPNRSRASSTNVRPPLTIDTLGRRRSSSLVHLRPSTLPQPSHPAPLQPNDISPRVPSPQPSPSMLAVLASRCLDLLHVPKNHSVMSSGPSSPHSISDEDSILPISASSQQTSFGDVHIPILVVILLFPLSTALVLFCLSTLPISVSWPHNLPELAQLGRELHAYSRSGSGPFAHVIGVLSITAVWKHAWSVPGSVLWNVLAGALFSPALATLLLTALTTIGSLLATLLSTPLAPFLTRLLPRALDMTRNALEGESSVSTGAKSKSSAWVRLSVLRLIGVVPWSGINIACGVCGVAITDCMLGAFIGCLPWTAVTCQIGDILQTVASTSSPAQQSVSSLLTSPEIIVKLVLLSFLSLAPILGRERLRALISSSGSPDSDSGVPHREGVAQWVQEWRSKMRLPRSRSRTREDDQKELETLVQEKQGLA
ncbi:hypothetical protein SERLADRAFT_446813 [Serpula lacrymans var. lacrymans S7.9]|uniref:VTT domain-containing protein n=1 Tax=Serpula lacrymans var. lacrymans (strain S7.9) TaxID=578457 RepID=F8NNE8_SERL9|nr:uncharacterized protein SERLADRAFT_446813 [Serpula lacrymans var. lacrymans S7.9]EGO27578.1 hypothetical protein SERLADRAFT_446813 [Serpula lacrymans var. lacrymans S7.9]